MLHLLATIPNTDKMRFHIKPMFGKTRRFVCKLCKWARWRHTFFLRKTRLKNMRKCKNGKIKRTLCTNTGSSDNWGVINVFWIDGAGESDWSPDFCSSCLTGDVSLNFHECWPFQQNRIIWDLALSAPPCLIAKPTQFIHCSLFFWNADVETSIEILKISKMPI